MGNLFGGGSGRPTVGYRYYMSLFMALCRGPVDSIEEIVIGDRKAWPKAKGKGTAQDPVNDTGLTEIKAGDLFGGDKREGGVEGKLHVYMGKSGQTISNRLKGMIGGRVPEMRGVVTMWFDGLIASLNPYPKPWKIRVRRTVNGWDGAVWQPKLAVIWLDNKQVKAYNPIHILYEAATNYDWGRDMKRALLDDAKWVAAAKQIKKEEMGLCLAYRRSDDLDQFVENVVKHIGASIYTDRETGLLAIKLIRNDYTKEDLPLYTYDTGLLSVEEDLEFMPSQAVNEVVVKYHHVVSDQDREVRAQNLASIQEIGRNPVEIDYTGFATHRLAVRAANRDLRGLAITKKFKITLDRRAWQEFPGSVFRISAPERQLADVIIRAIDVEYQSIEDGEKIIVTGAFDVFGLPASDFVGDQESEWSEPSTDPLNASNYIIREMTYHEFVVNATRYVVNNLDPVDSGIAAFAVRPFPMAMNYNVLSRSGVAPFTGTFSIGYAASALLVGAITAYDEDIEFDTATDVDSLEEGMLIQIDSEMIRINTFTYDEDAATGTLNISRGIIDTIPAPHDDNARWFVISDLGTDAKDWITSDVVDVKFQTVTSTAVIDEGDVPTQTIIINARQNRPYAPGNVKVNTTPIFQGVTFSSEPSLNLVGQTTLTLTWAHRDRISQQDVIVAHEEGSVGPEAGVQYRCQITDLSDAVVVNQLVSGTVWNYALAGIGAGTYKVKIAAERDGLLSRAVYSRKFVK